jgi:hypothetical protein
LDSQQFVGLYGKVAIQYVLIKKRVRSPTKIICVASSFISFWAGLHKGADKEVLEVGVEALNEAALSFHPQADVQEDQGTYNVMLQ